MKQDHDIISQVLAAQSDIRAADDLVRQYLPFIKAETAKFLKRPPREDDDELSIAMFAFHEAVMRYDRSRGAFLPLAALAIRNRLVDHYRKEQRHRAVSLDQPTGEKDGSLMDTLTAPDELEFRAARSATRQELTEFAQQLTEFGLTLADISENCPRQDRTLAACQRVLAYAKTHPILLEELVRTKKLPLGQLAQGSGQSKKTLERHRKYLVAILLAYTNGFEIIRGHLRQMKGGAA